MINIKNCHVILKHLNLKWEKGHSPLVAICGETNSGKTMTALSIADVLTKGNFNPETNMFVDVEKFIIKFYKSTKEVFIIDEAKIHLDSGRWYTNFSRLFGDIIATQRHRNNLYIVILPVLKKLAKEHRDMIDVIIEKKSQRFAHTYIVNRRWSELKEFELWKFFTGGMVIDMPPKNLVDKYRNVERLSKDKIMSDIITKLIKVKRCECGKANPDIDGCAWCGERVGVGS